MAKCMRLPSILHQGRYLYLLSPSIHTCKIHHKSQTELNINHDIILSKDHHAGIMPIAGCQWAPGHYCTGHLLNHLMLGMRLRIMPVLRMGSEVTPMFGDTKIMVRHIRLS